MSKVTVLLFTTKNCPDCKAAKTLLNDLKKKYDFNIREMDLERWYIEALQHQVASAPSIVIGNHVVSRGEVPEKKFLIEEIKKAMGIKAKVD
ncbi:MAG: glutaredoxin [Candidatus Hydrothermarchaeales archaeon]